MSNKTFKSHVDCSRHFSQSHTKPYPRSSSLRRASTLCARWANRYLWHSPRPRRDGVRLAGTHDTSPSRLSPRPASPGLAFVEKPSTEAAEALLEGGMHLWNAGIFLFSTSVILEAFADYVPEILAGVRIAYDAADTDLGFTHWSTAGSSFISL